MHIRTVVLGHGRPGTLKDSWNDQFVVDRVVPLRLLCMLFVLSCFSVMALLKSLGREIIAWIVTRRVRGSWVVIHLLHLVLSSQAQLFRCLRLSRMKEGGRDLLSTWLSSCDVAIVATPAQSAHQGHCLCIIVEGWRSTVGGGYKFEHRRKESVGLWTKKITIQVRKREMEVET